LQRLHTGFGIDQLLFDVGLDLLGDSLAFCNFRPLVNRFLTDASVRSCCRAALDRAVLCAKQDPAQPEPGTPVFCMGFGGT